MILLRKGIGCFMNNEGLKVAQEQFKQIVGLKPTRVKLGVGSFITFDFGQDIPKEIETRRGKETIYFGEWYLWVYMCAWRIDLSEMPFLASHDDRNILQKKISVLNNKKILKITVVNDAFDLLIQFEDQYVLKLFSTDTTEEEQWLFYTPNGKVFTAGPGSKWSYDSSN